MIQAIFNQFQHKGDYQSHISLIAGHINDTYLVKTNGASHYVLQKINHHVFPNIPALIENKIKTTQYIKVKYIDQEIDPMQKVLTFIPTHENQFYHQDENGCFWNLMLYIQNAVTFDAVSSPKIAYEGGKLFGTFLRMTSDFDISQLHEVIPDFHNMKYRLTQLDDAIATSKSDSLEKAQPWLAYIQSRKKEILHLQQLQETGQIPLRLTHNDTKISNALFDKNENGLCVIDLDTIMPGIIHFDFGDAIRTMCNSAKEDEKDISKVHLNMEYFSAFVKGFAAETKTIVNSIEIQTLLLGAKYITFIQGIRILTDFLNGNIYYKVDYADHNLVRARNQLRFLQLLEESEGRLGEIIEEGYL